MKPAIAICAVAAALLTAACAYTPQKPGDQAAIDAQIAARQGKEVDNICFTRDIHGWRELGDHAVLVEKGVNDWYKLDLTGTCRPDWAFNTIALRTRPSGSLCLTRGDTVATYTLPGGETCFINAIHQWDEKAPIPRATTH
jgi:Family of unknown function (DUF6491)